MSRPGFFFSIVVLAVVLVFQSACSDEQGSGPVEKSQRKGAKPITLSIVAGSESKEIETVLMACAKQNGISLRMHYSGSVDMMLDLSKPDFPYDAVMPASSIWMRLGDRRYRRIKEEASIMRSPVGLGVKQSIARSLGWIGTDVTVGRILEAVRSGKIRFAMTSATQSNSGFSSYIGMLIALAGNPDVLTAEHLNRPSLRESIRNLLAGVNRGSGSSGWLMHTFVEDYDRLDAMFNYESMIIAANQKLVAEGKEPLMIVYPVDGLAVADSTLGFVDKPGSPDNTVKKGAFIRFRDCLLSAPMQKKILMTGFRAGLIGMNPDDAPAQIYNTDWGIDLKRTISPIVWPDGEVTYKALTLYQTVFRKPSLTVFALDCSGSMKGQGLSDLKRAMTLLFDPATAGEYLIQTGQEDITVVIPFDDGMLWEKPLVVRGNRPEDLDGLRASIEALQPGGKTNIYLPVATAWQFFTGMSGNIQRYLPSVILMTDGHSNVGSLGELMASWNRLEADYDLPPVFCIMYGDASDEQLGALAEATHGRVFDGRKEGLDRAFRQAKGYN